MKKIGFIAVLVLALQACNNGKVERGVVNDGIKPVDTNGGLADTPNARLSPAIDTALGEDRTDLQRRDTTTLRR